MAYSKHDCQIVCRLKGIRLRDSLRVAHCSDMDVVGVAHAFGLLRLPRMPELAGHDLNGFKRCDVETSKIPFKDEKREAARQKALQERAKEKASPKVGSPYCFRSYVEIQKGSKQKLHGKRQRTQSEGQPGNADEHHEIKRKRKKSSKKSQWDELQEEQRLLKKFKKGMITKDELNRKLDRAPDDEGESDDVE